jgi:hypothetical protein
LKGSVDNGARIEDQSGMLLVEAIATQDLRWSRQTHRGPGVATPPAQVSIRIIAVFCAAGSSLARLLVLNLAWRRQRRRARAHALT